MTDSVSQNRDPENTHKEFTFLCVVDDSPELSRALLFSCQRAKAVGGRVALAYIIPPAEFQHWMGVGELMQEESRAHAEQLMSDAADEVIALTDKTPLFFVREGDTAQELIKLINEDKSVSLLVLGAATGKDGPGPLVSYLVEKAADELMVPITIVPGNLTDEHINEIT